MGRFKKFLLRIFKIKPENKLLLFPLDLKKFDRVIILCEDNEREIEKIMKELGIKNYLIMEESKENEDKFLNSITRRSLIIDLRKEDKKIFFKYISKDFPVIGIRKDLKFVLPGNSVKEFFGYFSKILV